MCVILFAVGAHPRYPLVVAANRDEWFHRPTAVAAFWADAPSVFAGRDLEQRGTWMGISRCGRFAAVTNVREGGPARADVRSRGALVSGFLTGTDAPASFAAKVAEQGAQYNGFNLLAGDRTRLMYLSNRGGTSEVVPPGVHGLSNHLLNTAWPKVQQGKARLAAALEGDDIDIPTLFDILGDRSPAPAGSLPDTGVAPERERVLSALHVLAGDYGTRTATVLLVGADGRVVCHERSFDKAGSITGEVREAFMLYQQGA
ncbi:MAG: NRDE family protein [Burkholderiales bacterium]